VKTIAGTVRQASFQIPASVVISVATTYQVSIAGTTSTGVAFLSGNTAALTVIPAASIVSVSPQTGQPGQTLSVTITGSGTNFVQGSTSANFGAGISVGGAPAGTFGPVTVTSPTTAVASIAIAPNANPGGLTVVVDPNGQQAASTSGFTVVGTPTMTGITNLVSLLPFSASAGSSPLFDCNLSSNCFTIQQNFYVVTPGKATYEQEAAGSGYFTYWVQNIISIYSSGGRAYAYPFVQVFDPTVSQAVPIVNTFGIPLGLFSAPEVQLSGGQPANLMLASTISGISGGTITLTTYVNGTVLSLVMLSKSNLPLALQGPQVVGVPLTNLTGGSYIGVPSQVPGTPGPPELVLVGPPSSLGGSGGGSVTLNQAAGSVSSQITMSNATGVNVQVTAIGGVGGRTQTGEVSTGLLWPNLPVPLTTQGLAWTTSNSPQFTAQFTTSGGSCAVQPTGELGLFLVSLNATTGVVQVNGGDPRGPTTPFTWIWGDGSTTQGFFPQSHTYPNVQQNYSLQVISHENDGSTDCTQLSVTFVTRSPSSFEGIWFEPANGTAALVDDFTQYSVNGLSIPKTNLWTTSSSFLNSLAAASSSPPASLVTPPQLSLIFSAAGMEMSGVNGLFETAGVQSLTTFTAPFTVQATIEGTQATGNPFEIFLVSQDLSQFLTVSGNLSASNGGYYGIWATAPNISQLWQLGEQLQPATLAAPNTEYAINISVAANGSATVNIVQTNGTLSGSVSNLQPGVGPFYLVLGQREGLPFNGPGPNVAYWGSVSVTKQ
jgi:hypothetical protein